MRPGRSDLCETAGRERFGNPCLDHRIADIAQNHVRKLERRTFPLIELANALSTHAKRSAALARPAGQAWTSLGQSFRSSRVV